MTQKTGTTAKRMWPTVLTAIDHMDVTISTVLVLTAFYLLRFISLPVSSETLSWLFIAKANPSPGWIFAPLLHAGLTHYVANVGQLLYFGIVPDRTLRRWEYVGFFAVSGVLTTLAQMLVYNLRGIDGGLAGASGATMAVMGFTTTRLLLHRFNWVDDPGVGNRFSIRSTLLLMGLVWMCVQLFSDFYPGWTIAPKASGVAHLSGIILGMSYAVYHARRSSQTVT